MPRLCPVGLSRKAGLSDADFEKLERVRNRTPATPMNFE